MSEEREKDLPSELREYIDAVRKAAFAAGYEAAKLELVAAKLKFAAASFGRSGTLSAEAKSQAPPPAVEASGLSSGGEMPRGIPEMYVEEEYRAIAPRAARVVDIALRIQDKRGVDIAKTTLHRAVKRLGERGVLERIGNTAAWRYVSRQGGGVGGLSNDQMEESGSNMPSVAKGNGAAPMHS